MGDARPALVAFDAECAALVHALEDLTSDDWNRPTNCPPWDLHELVVHIAFSVRLPDAVMVTDEPPGATAVDYYRRPERATTGYRSDNVERTQRAARRVERGDAASLVKRVSAATSATFASLAPDRTLEAARRKLTVDDYALTRLMSVAAHGVDVAITLSRPPWTTQDALDALRPVLVDLLGETPPSAWTDQDLLELGTGRRMLTAADTSALGSAVARFPLLS